MNKFCYYIVIEVNTNEKHNCSSCFYCYIIPGSSLGKFLQSFAVDYGDTLSVRTGPGTHYKKIYALPRDTANIAVSSCRKISNHSRWCRITYPEKGRNRSIHGWVNGKYLFPVSSDPLLVRKDTIEKTRAFILDIIKAIVENRPCDLNEYINKPILCNRKSNPPLYPPYTDSKKR